MFHIKYQMVQVRDNDKINENILKFNKDQYNLT